MLNVTTFVDEAIVLHWSGRLKPWAEFSFLDYNMRLPFLKIWDLMVAEGYAAAHRFLAYLPTYSGVLTYLPT
jgi:hypothetical protein